MFRRTLAMAIFAGLLALPSFAQGTDNDLESEFGTRTSISVDKKISKGFHADGFYELRTEGSSLDSHRAGVGVSYKFTPWLKGEIGYIFIDSQSSSGEWRVRHRLNTSLTGIYKTGDWQFSLKETLQLTHKTESINRYQEVRNPLTLKSRIKAAYKGFNTIEPYAYAEIRTIFNDPACTATWDAASSSYTSYTFDGYNDISINRYRAALGLEWKITKQHGLDFGLLFDYCRDKDTDTNKEGTKLKSLTYDRTFITSLKIGYTYSF